MISRPSAILFSITFVLLLNSCAVYMANPVRKVRVVTDKPAKIVYKSIYSSIDTIPTSSENEAILFFEKGNRPATFTVRTDTSEQAVSIQPKKSFGYNLYTIPTWGIAGIFLKENPKSYSYPRRVYLNSNAKISYLTLPEKNKGSLYVRMSLPVLNHFHSRPIIYNPQNNFGMLGFSAGVEYYHHDKQFIAVEGLFATSIIVNAVHDPNAYEFASTFYMAASYNHDISKSIIGYGMTVGYNDWRILETSLYDDPYKQRFVTVGLIGKAYHRMNNNWSFGLIYRPTFLRDNGTWAYEHLISVDLAFRFRVKK